MALLLASAWKTWAQNAPATAADDATQAEKGAFFPALEEYGKNAAKSLVIREKMLFEITAREERVKKLDAIAVSFQAMRRAEGR